MRLGLACGSADNPALAKSAFLEAVDRYGDSRSAGVLEEVTFALLALARLEIEADQPEAALTHLETVKRYPPMTAELKDWQIAAGELALRTTVFAGARERWGPRIPRSTA